MIEEKTVTTSTTTAPTIFERYHSTQGYSSKKSGQYGLEIETEVKDGGSYPEGVLPSSFFDDDEGPYNSDHYLVPEAPLWHVCKDGSLRNFGVEWVLAKPLPMSTAMLALDQWARVTKDVPFLPEPPGCSVHIHVNMQDMTVAQMGNFICLWLMFENVLVEYCGRTRRSNLFALPTRHAEGNLHHIRAMFDNIRKGAGAPFTTDPQSSKYAALNIARMRDLCTLEIRPMRGTTDVLVIKSWLRTIDKLVTWAKKLRDPYEILNAYRGEDQMERFFFSVFEEMSPALLKALPEDIPLRAYLDRSMFYVAAVAFETTDWSIMGAMNKQKSKNLKPWEPLTSPSPAVEIGWGDLQELQTQEQVLAELDGLEDGEY